MSPEIVERVLFVMPRDRELQFAAMAVLQAFVGDFHNKMRANDLTKGRAVYRLEYGVSGMRTEDWEFFQWIGLELDQQPVVVEHPEMTVLLAEERLEQFIGTGKHVVQVCGVMCGIGCPPIPKVRKVKPRKGGPFVWVGVGEWDPEVARGARRDPNRQFHWETGLGLGLQESETVSGVVGWQGWETYLACAQGYPVVEIVPAGRPRNWLSKFTHPLYRMVDGTGDIEAQVARAVANLEEICRCSQVPADYPVA